MQAKQVIEKETRKKEELHVILGISGNTGGYIADELLRMGYKVKGISRSGNGPSNIENIKVDALNLDELVEAVQGASVIYHCLGLPYSQWADKHPIIIQNLIQAAATNGPETKIVFADNLYALGKKGARLGPMNEQTPELASDKKGLLRKQLAHMLLDAHQQGKIRVSIGRASDFFGPKSSNSVLDMFVKPNILRKKPAKLFANLATKHSYIYLPDFARSLVVLGTDKRSDGGVWILPHYQPRTIQEFIESFYESVGVNIPVKIRRRSMILLKTAALFNSDIKEYSKMTYQTQSDWVVDDSLFRKTFSDWESTDLNSAFNQTYISYKTK